jgi:hypothetical protein
VQDEIRRYKRDGFIVKQCARTATLERLNALCRDIFEGRIKNGYTPVVHYEGMASDLVLDHNYDPVLLDVLFENDLHGFMQAIVGENATLYHINAITSLPPGYMSEWHSDGYLVRRIHKMFYYPSFDGGPDPCLQVMPGHIKVSAIARNRLFTNKYTRQLEAAVSKKVTVTSANDSFAILHTETMHRAMPLTKPAGIFRLLYIFTDWFKNDEERERMAAIGGTQMIIDDELAKYYRNRVAGTAKGAVGAAKSQKAKRAPQVFTEARGNSN